MQSSMTDRGVGASRAHKLPVGDGESSALCESLPDGPLNERVRLHRPPTPQQLMPSSSPNALSYLKQFKWLTAPRAATKSSRRVRDKPQLSR